MIKQILIVCVGNICRSPLAEHLFRHHLLPSGIRVESAGLGALTGSPMDATAMQLLAEHGLDGREHRARQLSATMMRKADLVLAMEREHVTQMRRLAPEASGKLMLLDRWESALDIPDPYRKSREAFEHVFDMIEHGTQKWLTYLRPIPTGASASLYAHG